MSSRGLRIIAGSLKGRRLRVPVSAAVRPTPERVREALFNILGARIDGAWVLDAYAGSGALGFEAVSRGASRVSFVEADRRVAAMLRASASELGIRDACDVVEGRLPGALRALGKGGWGEPGRLFDVILADAPYAAAGEDREAVLEALAVVLDTEGLLLWERDSRSPPVQVPPLRLRESRRYGNTAVDLYHRTVPEGPEASSPLS